MDIGRTVKVFTAEPLVHPVPAAEPAPDTTPEPAPTPTSPSPSRTTGAATR